MSCFRCTSDLTGRRPWTRGAPAPRAPVAAPGGARGTGASPPPRRARPRGDPCALLPRSVHSGGSCPRGRYHAVGSVAVADHHEGRPARELSRCARSRRAFRPPAGGRISTSGSTGVPFEFYADRARHGQLARLSLLLPGLGRRRDLDAADRHLRSARPRGRRRTFQDRPRCRRSFASLVLGERVVAVAGADLTLAGFQDCVDRFPRRRPYFIRANPSYAARLAAQLLADGRVLARSPVAVMTGAETLTSAHESTIRAAFRCPVVNHYSTWEVPHMAQSCPDNPALLHVNSERVVLRVVGRRRARRRTRRARARGRHGAHERRHAVHQLRPRRLGRAGPRLPVRARISDAHHDRGPRRRDDPDPGGARDHDRGC